MYDEMLPNSLSIMEYPQYKLVAIPQPHAIFEFACLVPTQNQAHIIAQWITLLITEV